MAFSMSIQFSYSLYSLVFGSLSLFLSYSLAWYLPTDLASIQGARSNVVRIVCALYRAPLFDGIPSRDQTKCTIFSLTFHTSVKFRFQNSTNRVGLVLNKVSWISPPSIDNRLIIVWPIYLFIGWTREKKGERWEKMTYNSMALFQLMT